MKKDISVLSNIKKFRPDADINNGCVIAVGGFDGVHIGHRKMIEQLVCESKRLSVPSAVFTFAADDNPKSTSNLLCSAEQKNAIFKSLGVDMVICVGFSEIKDISAHDFIKMLFDELKVKSIICGYDFRFGKDRVGNVELIKEILSPLGVDVVTQAAVCLDGAPVSSTLIRQLISHGKIKKANKLLFREFSFAGEIVHGVRLASRLGFPTVNQSYPENLAVTRFGVYATKVFLDGKEYKGVTNVGVKPTFGGTEKPLCETHIIDFEGDCYGKTAEISFVDFIRPEIKFSSERELRLQIEKDKAQSASVLTERGV